MKNCINQKYRTDEEIYNKIDKMIDCCTTIKHIFTIEKIISHYFDRLIESESYYALKYKLHLKSDMLNLF